MRKVIHLAVLAFKQVTRHRVRSLLTVAGVAAGMFLFTAVETMQSSLRVATRSGADDSTLVVYRENRFCPSTSKLPEHYQPDIRRIPGVAEVIPIQIVVNNCGASLDVITFRGCRRKNSRLSIRTWKSSMDLTRHGPVGAMEPYSENILPLVGDLSPVTSSRRWECVCSSRELSAPRSLRITMLPMCTYRSCSSLHG